MPRQDIHGPQIPYCIRVISIVLGKHEMIAVWQIYKLLITISFTSGGASILRHF